MIRWEVRRSFFLGCFVGWCSAKVEGVSRFMWLWHYGVVEFSWAYGLDGDGLFSTENGWRNGAEESSSAKFVKGLILVGLCSGGLVVRLASACCGLGAARLQEMERLFAVVMIRIC